MKIIYFGLNTYSENRYFGAKMRIENKLYYILFRKCVTVVKTTYIAQKIHVLVKTKNVRLTLNLEGPCTSKQNQIAQTFILIFWSRVYLFNFNFQVILRYYTS